MIRHFKWHKKRDESLQHGFMRYSPMDDCSDRYRGCSHNRKQTHYHCIKVENFDPLSVLIFLDTVMFDVCVYFKRELFALLCYYSFASVFGHFFSFPSAS
jgi:hypothetical protein